MTVQTSTCVYCGAKIEWYGSEPGWVDTRSGDDGGTYDWCPESPLITESENLQPHKPS